MTAVSDKAHTHLSRRERQIMDVLHEQGEATAAQVHKALPDSPTYSTVRALLRKLLDKQHVNFREDGPRYVYRPSIARSEARRGAVRRLLDIFFNGSPVAAAVNLLGDDGQNLTSEEIDELESVVARLKAERARAEGSAQDEEPSDG